MVSLDTFDNNNMKDNYNQKILDIINKINACLFIYDTFIIGSVILRTFYIFRNYFYNYGKTKIIKKIILIIINLVYFLFEFLVIYKLILSYEIKKDDGIYWFMVLDYLFIILNLINTSCFIYSIYIFFKASSSKITIYKKNVLISFNNINIKEYNLPNNFDKITKNERKKYVLDNYKNFIPFISIKQQNLITSINDFRGINNIPLLGICNCNKIPDFIIKEICEVMLYNNKNIFKLSDNKYLFKYPIGEFEINFN